MFASLPALRPYGAALRALIALTLLLGVGYPLVVTGVAQLTLPHQANGSLVEAGGHVVGSSLLGQSWTLPDGTPDPRYVQPRPSAADYDAMASGGTNLGPSSTDLLASVEERRAAIATRDGVAPASVPADALTASGSGLDPDISPEYALLQVERVAAARGLPASEVEALVRASITHRDLGLLGEPRVNVLALNLTLDSLG